MLFDSLKGLQHHVWHKVRTITIFSISVLALRSEGYRKVPYHYYEVGNRDECAEYILHESAPYGGHRFITEKTVFGKWAKVHPIKFFHPEWQLSWPKQAYRLSQTMRPDWSKNTPCLNAQTNEWPWTARNNRLNLSWLHTDYSVDLKGYNRKEERRSDVRDTACFYEQQNNSIAGVTNHITTLTARVQGHKGPYLLMFYAFLFIAYTCTARVLQLFPWVHFGAVTTPKPS